MTQESALEKTVSMMMPPEKSIPIRCKTCNKLMHVNKVDMDDSNTNIKYSECHACALAKNGEKKEVEEAKKGFFQKRSTSKAIAVDDSKINVSCSRCKSKMEIPAKDVFKKSFLCVTCKTKAGMI